MVMKHTDRYTCLGLEFHELLGACTQGKIEFNRKRKFLNKVFVDAGQPEEGPRIIVRLVRHCKAKHEYVVAATVPLVEFERSKKSFFEDALDDDFVETYGLSKSLQKDIRNFEDRTGVVREDYYPKSVWELHYTV